MDYETEVGVSLTRRRHVEKFVVAYAKITTDKDDGVSLVGVFFGGLGDTLDEANVLAKECVNTLRGGTILPKVLPIEGDGQLMEAMLDATAKFEQVAAYMVEANEIISRTQKLNK